jgi:CubicO group peptidase (beta-lactamase class C family)
LGSSIDSIFSEFIGGKTPGAAAMVIRDGEVIHQNGYGLADLDSGRTLSRTTPVRLGSVGKQFTSMAIMILEERGDLSYDDQVTRWVPELGRYPGIRVRHLLQHTGGLPDYYELPREAFDAVADSDGDPLTSNRDAVKIYETWGDPRFEPGDRYEYSNPGYEVLALVVERISGQTFGAFLAENVFEPLGMGTATVRERPELPFPNRAIGYRPDSENGGWVENDDHFLNGLVGSGGIYASLGDLYLWDQALYTDGLVTHETLNEAFSPTVLNDGSVSEYGFGWNVSGRLGRPAVHHGGSWVGFRAAIIRFVEERVTVVVLSNASASAGSYANEMAELVLQP